MGANGRFAATGRRSLRFALAVLGRCVSVASPQCSFAVSKALSADVSAKLSGILQGSTEVKE
jgi:hypothetical protein